MVSPAKWSSNWWVPPGSIAAKSRGARHRRRQAGRHGVRWGVAGALGEEVFAAVILRRNSGDGFSHRFQQQTIGWTKPKKSRKTQALDDGPFEGTWSSMVTNEQN